MALAGIPMAMASYIEGRWHDAAGLEHVASSGLYSPLQSLSTPHPRP